MPDIFDSYRPLRNQLRQAQLAESLGVMRAYLQYLQFRQPLPGDVQAIPQFLNAKSKPDQMVFEWELEVITREIILHSPESNWLSLPNDLRRWDHFSSAVNRLKTLENEIAKLYGQENVLLEMYRLAHRQFPWQSPPNKIWLGRYYKIFGHPQLATIIERVAGLSAKELYTFGLAMTGFYLDKFAMDYPPRIEIAGLTQQKFDLFLGRFSKGIVEMRKMMEASQQLNETYVYTLNPLRQYPLIRMNVRGVERLVAPIPSFLFWRFTSGIYYEICNEKDFALPFGDSFQSYVGEVVAVATKKNPAISFRPEAEYHVGKHRKSSTDWIVDEKGAALFIEVKTKRLRLDAKIEIFSQDALVKELGKMAEFIAQLYTTIRDYRNNLYTNYPYDPHKKIFPLIVTLENWYLFGPPIEKELERQVMGEFERRSLDKKWLSEMPYSICCIEEFEQMVQIMAFRGINHFMGSKMDDPQRKQWPFASFIIGQYWDDYRKTKDLFPETIDAINPGIRGKA